MNFAFSEDNCKMLLIAFPNNINVKIIASDDGESAGIMVYSNGVFKHAYMSLTPVMFANRLNLIAEGKFES